MFITAHALQRMDERDITDEEIFEIFSNKYISLSGNIQKVIGRTDKGRFLTLFIANRITLVTVREATIKEKQLYRRKVK